MFWKDFLLKLLSLKSSHGGKPPLAPLTDRNKTCGVGGHPTRSGVNIWNQIRQGGSFRCRCFTSWLRASPGRLYRVFSHLRREEQNIKQKHIKTYQNTSKHLRNRNIQNITKLLSTKKMLVRNDDSGNGQALLTSMNFGNFTKLEAAGGSQSWKKTGSRTPTKRHLQSKGTAGLEKAHLSNLAAHEKSTPAESTLCSSLLM